MTPTEISSHVHTTPRQISYPHRVWQPTYDSPRRYTDETRTGLFHGFSIEGSAGDEIVTVCIIETADGSIVTPIATKCKFLDTEYRTPLSCDSQITP